MIGQAGQLLECFMEFKVLNSPPSNGEKFSGNGLLGKIKKNTGTCIKVICFRSWRSHLDTDFNLLVQFAKEEILSLRRG